MFKTLSGNTGGKVHQISVQNICERCKLINNPIQSVNSRVGLYDQDGNILTSSLELISVHHSSLR